MTDQFKTSELNRLFDVQSIKVPFDAGRFKEICDNLQKGFENHSIDIVVMSIDYNDNVKLDKNSEVKLYRPKYLTNSTFLDDGQYILNKEIFLNTTIGTIYDTIKHNKRGIDLDGYHSWGVSRYNNAKYAILQKYERPNINPSKMELSEKEKERIKDNIESNILHLVKNNPDTQFYFFFPPYSILYWDRLHRNNMLEKNKEIEILVTEMLLEYENVKYFSFNDDIDMIANLDNNYRDILHYCGDINSYILSCMKEGKGLLTKDNYKSYIDSCYETFKTYDYDSIYE